MAGTLAAVPLAAADEHPEPDYTADFSACEGVAGSGPTFEDVPAGHENAGDIDCIAYYGITKGTGDGSTYSPSMSVTREHMALFLTRLAGLVGIEVASDPSDAGFTDIGELSAESQTAINQLADLGITQGTSETTYSPADAVTRGHMALFIARLMDNMTPIGGDKSEWGHTPSDVIDDDDKDIEVGSPFTDLGSVTKSTYDAITELWELGVASGINATSYAPQASITRASMAEFMVGVMNHSNLRPAGLSIQTDKSSAFDSVGFTLAVSYRNDMFEPMVDKSITIFQASVAGEFDEETGKCDNEDECDWSDSENLTDESGNFTEDLVLGTDTGNIENSDTWYAWIGDDDNTDFVKGESGEVSVTVTALADALGIKVTSDVNKDASNVSGHESVDIRKDRTVTYIVQLINETTNLTTGNPDASAIAKKDVEIQVRWNQNTTGTPRAVFPFPTNLVTDDDGKARFKVTGPADMKDPAINDDRTDTVIFTPDLDEDDDFTDDVGVTKTVLWLDNPPVITGTGTADVPDYVIVDEGEVAIRVTVAFHDQYGGPAGQNDTLLITVSNTANDGGTSDAETVRVRSNGEAKFRGEVKAAAGDDVTISVGPLSEATTTTTDPGTVLVVRHANKSDDGETAKITEDTDNDRFIIDTDAKAGTLYSYDSGDTFIVDNKDVDMDAFEEAIAADGADGVTVNVVVYTTDPDGISIFSVTSPTTS